jgi:hypothetical protein
MNNELERMQKDASCENLRLNNYTSMDVLRTTTNTPRQDIRLPGLDSNPEPPEYERNANHWSLTIGKNITEFKESGLQSSL